MKRDEKNDLTRKTVRKINIDDVPKKTRRKDRQQPEYIDGRNQGFKDLPINDGEEFEFHPSFDTMDFFEEEIDPLSGAEQSFEQQEEGPKVSNMGRRKKGGCA